MANKVLVPYSLDDYMQSTPIGSLDKAIGNNVYGIDHMQIPGAVPSNRELQGFTFFVRPQLNLQPDNIRNVRKMTGLLNREPFSIQNLVRCSLDPRLQNKYGIGKHASTPINCPLVNNESPFISILTNNITAISGWPDIVSPVFTSAPGLYNQMHSMVDGVVQNYESFNIDATFRNTRADPIMYMFYIWLYYQSYVFEGRLVPYLDMITENEMDYCTRIFRITLDKQRQKVTKIGSTIAFPISVPTAGAFDFNTERPYNEQNKDLTIRFQAMGFEAYDDILLKEFNQTVAIFSPNMRDANRESTMVKLAPEISMLFRYRALPRIDPETSELEWWVPNTLFQNRTQLFLDTSIISSENLQDITSFTGD